jgi:hypothetical protein
MTVVLFLRKSNELLHLFFPEEFFYPKQAAFTSLGFCILASGHVRTYVSPVALFVGYFKSLN